MSREGCLTPVVVLMPLNWILCPPSCPPRLAAGRMNCWGSALGISYWQLEVMTSFLDLPPWGVGHTLQPPDSEGRWAKAA